MTEDGMVVEEEEKQEEERRMDGYERREGERKEEGHAGSKVSVYNAMSRWEERGKEG